MKKEFKLLVSGCLIGQPVRFDGGSKTIDQIDWLAELKAAGKVFTICPEVSGGLGIPRAPAEQQSGRVITSSGVDVTVQFEKGAQATLDACLENGVTHALMKAKSPSCGSNQVYDGTFSKQLIEGDGMAVKKLKQAGIKVYDETQVDQLQREITSQYL